MVGILIVSHSKQLAFGAKELAEQMIQADIPLEAVGGTNDGRLGTSSDMIYSTLEKMNKEEGVIIFADMGSAVMNLEVAFEFFPEEIRNKFVIANAPIVEGSISAALEASFGKSLEEILKSISEEDFSLKVS